MKVRHKNTFTIIPGEQNQPFNHPYSNKILKGIGCPDTSCTINSVKVNGVDQSIEIDQKNETDCILTRFSVPLKGDKSGYKMEIDATKVYSLKHDNIIGNSNNYIQNGFKVQIFLNGVTAKFHECGTLQSFKTIHTKDALLERQYTGLLYKRQGYIVYLQIK